MADRLFDAVIFDLDGVITHTALLHVRAWAQLFDAFLQAVAGRKNQPFTPFTREDYLSFVDGKPRYDGIVSFLGAKGVVLPYGSPNDPPHKETVCGLGNRKNDIFNDLLQTEGVTVFPTSVKLIEKLKKNGVKIGVASSSKNCRNILETQGLLDFFDVRVDGEVSEKWGLSGKPAPDIFTAACDRLGVDYDRAVVVEDAVSGVQAGRNGRFGLVIGVAREIDGAVLLKNGADLVVTDLGEIRVADIERWFETGLAADQWCIMFHDYDKEIEKTREALLAVGNGYLGTRGAMEESCFGGINYPGTYMAGVFNRLTSRVSGKDIENEDFVNCPNWLPVNFRIGDDPYMDINRVAIASISRQLDLKTGILHRDMVVKDESGRKTRIVSERLASMDDPHICALKYRLTPLNYQGEITVSAAIDGTHINDGVERYRDLNQKHLASLKQAAMEGLLLLTVKTTSSNIEIALAAGVRTGGAPVAAVSHETLPGRAEISYTYDARENQTFFLEKRVALYTSQDVGVDDPSEAADAALHQMPSFDAVKQASVTRWAALWEEMDIRLTGDRFSQKMLRLHMYHLMGSASPHNVQLDAGMPARGLHGEAYRGHIFWDELFILPFYDLHFPAVARSLLMYRYRRLDKARMLARAEGRKGAMFPWQSGSSGREETQVIHLNPMTGKWGPDHSARQRHVSLAIAFNIWQYYHITRDTEFMEAFGAEMFFEICRFFADMARLDPDTGRFHIDGVMGPDEFHEKYPEIDIGGLTDNAYTNLMVHWALAAAGEIFAAISGPARKSLHAGIGVDAQEIEQWRNIATRLNVVMTDDVMAQFDGYFSLAELDWYHYRGVYGDIHRLDRILKKEGKSPDQYKAAKQADVLMAFFVLGDRKVSEILTSMGYEPGNDFFGKNLAYYMPRTSHGSTLSRVVHSALAAAQGDARTSWQFYQEALASDYSDVQGGTTGEGIHTGVMAGTVLLAMTTYGGLRIDGEAPRIHSALPGLWKRIRFGVWFRSVRYEFDITRSEVIMRKQMNTDH